MTQKIIKYTYRIYSDEEIKYIKEHYNGSGNSLKNIANKLGRTQASVRMKIQNLSMARKKKREGLNIEQKLTRAEQEVYQQLLEGKTAVVIAEQLFKSVTTIKTHRMNILCKMNVHSVNELLARKIKELEIEIEIKNKLLGLQ